MIRREARRLGEDKKRCWDKWALSPNSLSPNSMLHLYMAVVEAYRVSMHYLCRYSNSITLVCSFRSRA